MTPEVSTAPRALSSCAVSSPSRTLAGWEKAADYPKTAAVAYKPADLTTLLAEKLPCWRWAAFASVLVQRHAEVQSRLRDDQLGYGAPSGERVGSGAEVGRFVVDRMDELLTLVNQVESFMLTPASSAYSANRAKVQR